MTTGTESTAAAAAAGTSQTAEQTAAATAAAATAAAATAAASGTTAPEWLGKDAAPEIVKHVLTKGYATPADVVKAHINAESAIGADKIVLPKDGIFTDAATRTKLGIPDKPEGYKVVRPEMPQGVAYDEKFEKSMMPVAHQLGLTPAQVNGLIKAVSDHRLGEFQSGAAAAQTTVADAEKALRTEFGVAFDQKIAIAQRAVAHFGGQAMADELNKTGLGNHPELIKAFAKIGASMGEDALKSGQSAGGALTPAEAKAESQKLMLTDAYKNRNDPGHDDMVKKVAALFEMQFPAQAA